MSFKVLLLLLFATCAFAQIKSPALDSNCYFPQIDDASQMDSIHGFSDGQLMGEYVYNLGVKPDGKPGNMLIAGLSPAVALSEPSWDVAESGPTFNLHKLKRQPLTLPTNGIDYRRGHFRDSKHLDIICGSPHGFQRIYWQDNEGNFDSLHYTDLNLRRDTNYNVDESFSYYIAHLSSDTVDDVAVAITKSFLDPTRDTFFLGLYRGGIGLGKSTLVFPDTETVLTVYGTSTDQFDREFSQGDFRGTGREDLIASDSRNNLYFYANDRPFDLGRFAHALFFDTLLAEWQNPQMYHSTKFGNSLGFNLLSMRAMPKKADDRSADFLPVIPIGSETNYNIYIFGGSQDFGKLRLYLDSASFVIHNPATIDPFIFNIGMSQKIGDCGDLTGLGYHAICWRGGTQHYGSEFYYLTGSALDEEADMYTSGEEYASLPDTLSANADTLEDLLLGRPNQITQADHDKGWFSVGSLQLIYGSNRIPIRLNPKYRNVLGNSPAALHVKLWPNPASDRIFLEIDWPKAELVNLEIRDVLGREVQRCKLSLIQGVQAANMDITSLPVGPYNVVIRNEAKLARTRFVIQR